MPGPHPDASFAAANRSICRALTASLIATVIAVSTVTVSLVYLTLSRKAMTELNHKADDVIGFLPGVLEISLWDRDKQNVSRIGLALAQNELIEHLQITDDSGEVYFDFSHPTDGPVVRRQSEIFHQGRRIGYVNFALSQAFVKRANRRLLLSVIGCLSVAILVLVAATGFLLRVLLNRPLEQLGQIVGDYAQGRYKVSHRPMPYREFQPLVAVLATMGDRIVAQMEQLRQAEQKYKGIFENAVEGIFQATFDGRFASVNPSLARILGYGSPGELAEGVTNISKEFCVSPELCSEFFHKMKNRESFTRLEAELYRKDGERVWVRVNARPVLDEEGEPFLVEGVVEDITEQRRAEAVSEQHARELDALHNLGLAVNASLSLEQTANAALKGMLEAVKADLAFIFRLDGEDLTVLDIEPSSARQELRMVPHRLGECICGLAAQQGKALYACEIHSDERCTWDECKLAGIHSLCALPLIGNDGVIGVIGLASKTERDFKAQADLLATLTHQVAVAFANARLYEVALREVAERKQAEDALRESERKYRELVEHANSIILRWNRDAVITFVNEFGLRFFGYEEHELLGSNVMETIVPPTDTSGRDLRPLMRNITDDPVSFEQNINENVLRDGSRVWIAWTNKAVLDESGNLIEVLSIGTDITESIRAEEALRSERQFLLAIIDFLPDATFVIDTDRRVAAWNRAAEAMTGVKREALLGKGNYEYAVPFYGERRPMLVDILKASDEACEKFFSNIARSGESVSAESYIPGLNNGCGAYLWSVAAPLYDSSGRSTGAIEVIRDVTELKRAEAENAHLQAQLLQAQKMEAVGTLAGGVAHDSNNMLGVILGHAQLAMTQCAPTETIYASLETIEQAAYRSADIIRQLLAFARKQTAQPRVLNLNDTVGGMLKMLGRLIGENIESEWRPGEDLWSVKIDPSQIDQILANLCVNARDAIDGVGKVTVETKNIVFDQTYCDAHLELRAGEYVMLAVSDSGCGMDAQLIEHIFEPFYTTKEPGKGTGLGLSTVYGIVKQNNGYINVYSEPGSGSTFKIYFPKFGAEAKSTTTRPVDTIQKGMGETVLLVEDDALILEMARAMLEHLGYTVITASSPREGLLLAKENAGRIQLLITDVVMPEMNGREMAILICEANPGLKCLFASGYTADVIAHRGILEDGVNFLQKPYSMKALASKVREILG
ncbi:MAG: PAS domain S-box protein [Syntrophobacteraceae bacterium]